MTFFLVCNLPHLYKLFDVLFHHLQTLTEHCTATKRHCQNVFLQEAVFQDHMSALLPGMWFYQQQCKLCCKETAGTRLTNLPPAWGHSGGLTLQFCSVCWECRFISHNCLIIRIGWFYSQNHTSLTSLRQDITEGCFLSDTAIAQGSEDTTKLLWPPGCGKGGRWHSSVEYIASDWAIASI